MKSTPLKKLKPNNKSNSILPELFYCFRCIKVSLITIAKNFYALVVINIYNLLRHTLKITHKHQQNSLFFLTFLIRKMQFSPNAALFGAHAKNDEFKKRLNKSSAPTNLPFVQSSPMGRFGAKRPTCSMAEVLTHLQIL